MARIRTIPETTVTIATDTVKDFVVRMYYNADGSADTSRIKLVYNVCNRDSEGAVINTEEEIVPFIDWPINIKTDLKNVYSKILIDAENKGLIGAGTDTDDLP